MGLKEKYARRKLKKLAAKVVRQPKVPNLETAKLIGVIWQPTQKAAYTYLKNYFKRDQVIFRGICIFEATVNPPEYNNTIGTNDLNWWGLPKPEKTEDFLQLNFDILLNIALAPNLPVDYITALSPAKFKVGSSAEQQNYFDLNIKINPGHDALYLAQQQIFYLAQLNKKTIL